MTATLLPRTSPAALPAPKRKRAWVSKGAGKLSEHKAVTTPVEITVFALTQEEAEIKVDEWIKEQYDGTH